MGTSLPKHYTKTLDNGLQIVAIEMNNGTGVVSTNIYYKVGSRNEVMGKSGIAHMLEHLNFKSTKNLQAGEFDEIVKGFGGINNASTGFDYTHYYIKSSVNNLSKSLELFSELMQNLTLKEKEFQKERDVVAEERRWRTDNDPMGHLYFKLFNHSYVYHPYHWTPIGFMNDIQTWTLNDIKSFHQTYYQPKNAIIVVAGDIKKEEVFKTATQYFKSIKNHNEIPNTVHMIEPKQNGEKNITIYKESEVQMLALSYHIPNFEHPDQVALSALSELLSGGKSSLLHKVLVDDKRMVNAIYAYNMELKDPGVYLIIAVCNPNIKAKDVKKEILKQLNAIKKGSIEQTALDKIKINTKADFIFSLEDSAQVASLYGSYLVRDNIKPLLSYEDKINTLTKKDIVDVANRYLIDKNLTTLILKKDN